MKIALCSTFVPFIHGGARNIVDWLVPMLQEYGHHVESIYLPDVSSADLLFQQMMALRWIDLSAADRIICFRPQSHFIPHPHKILWFIHHIRAYYDCWDTPYGASSNSLKDREIRTALHEADTKALLEAKQIFTNSKVVSDRLRKYNKFESEVLYPPVFQPERFHSRNYNDEIVCICRLEHHKRQHLLIEALSHTQEPVKLRLCGLNPGFLYYPALKQQISQLKLENRVKLEHRWVSEEEKIEYLADCLAAAYLPLDEDSYGYPSVEASLASKAVLTTSDSGGVLELIKNGFNGYVTEPHPQALANAMDQLYRDRLQTKKMGDNAKNYLSELNISWTHVLERLLA